MSDDTKDKRRIFRSIPGQHGKVKILLSKRPTEEGETPPAPPEEGGYLPPTGAADDLIVPRSRKTLRLLDLSTRLRSAPDPHGGYGLRFRAPDSDDRASASGDDISEHVPIGLSWPPSAVILAGGTGIRGVRGATVSNSTHADYTRFLLGPRYPGEPRPHDTLDPLGSSRVNGSTRLASNAKTLFPGVFGYVADVYLGGILVGPDVWEIAPASAAERWNPLDFIPNELRAKLKKSLTGQVRVGRHTAAQSFRSFDTGDVANFKVTTLPRFDADAVPFALRGAKWLDIYLVPELQTFGIGVAGLFTDLASPSFSFLVAPRSIWYGGNIGCELRRVFGGSVGGNTGYVFGPFLSNPAPAGSLAAILNFSGGPRYVWRRTDGSYDTLLGAISGVTAIPDCGV